MYNTNITEVELGMSCIVLIGYIVGKVWIHYKVEDTNNKETNKCESNRVGIQRKNKRD